MAIYNGSIELISGLKPKNGNDFPLVTAHNVQVDDNGTRLDEVLAGGGIVKMEAPEISITGNIVKLEHKDSKCDHTSLYVDGATLVVERFTGAYDLRVLNLAEGMHSINAKSFPTASDTYHVTSNFSNTVVYTVKEEVALDKLPPPSIAIFPDLLDITPSPSMPSAQFEHYIYVDNNFVMSAESEMRSIVLDQISMEMEGGKTNRITVTAKPINNSASMYSESVHSNAIDVYKLKKPTVSINGDTLTISDIDDILGHKEIYVDDEPRDHTEGTSYNLNNLYLFSGTYDIKVRILSMTNDFVLNSDFSDPVTYTV